MGFNLGFKGLNKSILLNSLMYFVWTFFCWSNVKQNMSILFFFFVCYCSGCDILTCLRNILYPSSRWKWVVYEHDRLYGQFGMKVHWRWVEILPGPGCWELHVGNMWICYICIRSCGPFWQHLCNLPHVNHEDGGSTFLWNFSIHLQECCVTT